MKKRELITVAILTVLLASIEIIGLPSSLFLDISTTDITPLFWPAMFVFIAIGIAVFLTLKHLCPKWKLGLNAKRIGSGLKKYGAVGIIVGVLSAIAFCVGLQQPFDYNPTVWEILIEGVIYCFGMVFVEELYVRGLLLNLIEKLFSKSKSRTIIAIVASAVIFGLGHIFDALGQSNFVMIMSIIWMTMLGIYLGAVYKKTNNLWLPIILHFIIDVCALPCCFTAARAYPTVSLYIILPSYIILGIYGLYIMKNHSHSDRGL